MTFFIEILVVIIMILSTVVMSLFVFGSNKLLALSLYALHTIVAGFFLWYISPLSAGVYITAAYCGVVLLSMAIHRMVFLYVLSIGVIVGCGWYAYWYGLPDKFSLIIFILTIIGNVVFLIVAPPCARALTRHRGHW